MWDEWRNLVKCTLRPQKYSMFPPEHALMNLIRCLTTGGLGTLCSEILKEFAAHLLYIVFTIYIFIIFCFANLSAVFNITFFVVRFRYQICSFLELFQSWLVNYKRISERDSRYFIGLNVMHTLYDLFDFVWKTICHTLQPNRHVLPWQLIKMYWNVAGFRASAYDLVLYDVKDKFERVI